MSPTRSSTTSETMLAVRRTAARIDLSDRKYGRLDLMSPTAAGAPSCGAASGACGGGASSVATGRVILRGGLVRYFRKRLYVFQLGFRRPPAASKPDCQPFATRDSSFSTNQSQTAVGGVRPPS